MTRTYLVAAVLAAAALAFPAVAATGVCSC